MSSNSPPTNLSTETKEKNLNAPLLNPTANDSDKNMSSDTPSTPKASELKSNSSLDPIAEFERLKLETEEINRKIMKASSFLNPTADTFEDKIGEELSKLKLEYSRQKIEIELMKRERDSIKNEVKTNDFAFKTQLSGSWKIVYSSNLEQYLQKRRAAAPTTTDLDDVIFHVAVKNISFSADEVMLHEHIGSMKYNEKVAVLNEPVINEKGAESGELTWISGNSMKTVSIGSDGFESCEEYSVENDELCVITRGYGVTCVRFYEREDCSLKKKTTLLLEKFIGKWKKVDGNCSDLSLKINIDALIEHSGLFFHNEYKFNKTTCGLITTVELKEGDHKDGFEWKVVQRKDNNVAPESEYFFEGKYLINIKKTGGGDVVRTTFARA